MAEARLPTRCSINFNMTPFNIFAFAVRTFGITTIDIFLLLLLG